MLVTEHMQAHTFPTVPGHRPPGAPALAQKHPHIRCQMTEKSVFDLTQSGQALLLLTSHAYCLWVFSSSQPPGWPQYSKLKQILKGDSIPLATPSSLTFDMTARDSRQLVTFIHCTLSVHFSVVEATVNRVADALQLQLLKGAQQHS